MTKEELKIVALTQRIAEITANYEENLADIRADFTLLKEEHERLKAESVSDAKTKDGPGDEYQ